MASLTAHREELLAFRIDRQTVGVPVNGTALMAVGGRMWALQPHQRYVLQAAVLVEKAEGMAQEAWTGRLDLPPVNNLQQGRTCLSACTHLPGYL